MPRDSRVYLDDILEATRKITSYTANLSKAAFLEDEKTFDAVVRNLEVIGEAVKKLPDELRAQHPTLEWKKMAGLRDILIHEYFGLDSEIVWDIVKNKVPTLNQEVRAMLNQ
ncbi:MAG: DUF86 domain-containing protein [Nitrospira sp.]|nr:DUF86 domain-containing protein [Nitrospira sp.]MDH4242675.1 DUF86 domain-containing protein [Nitrospira sp.]MDH4355056.1 DUF86 domain-containing protein [Nitrospira sp.]MDH5316958.1 DUF86 domain-containing protein [Nitrospira sp.]